MSENAFDTRYAFDGWHTGVLKVEAITMEMSPLIFSLRSDFVSQQSFNRR